MTRTSTLTTLGAFTALSVALAAAPATARIILVPDEETTIQAGLDAAAPGDEVRVTAGTYIENIVWPAVNGIRLIGAGAGATVIDGNHTGSVIRFETPDVIDGSTLVQGFTLTNGYAPPAYPPDSFGGGVYLFYADPVLRDLAIVGNQADDFGGGVYSWGADPTFIRVLITGNTAAAYAGFACKLGSPHLDRVTVAGNNPGGIYFDTRDLPLVENCIVGPNNDYSIELQGTYEFPTRIQLAYSDLVSSPLLVGVVTVHDLGGNISANPMFVTPTAGDYHLQAGSPCIDTGNPATPPDPDGTRADMGAFPFTHAAGVQPFAVAGTGTPALGVGPNPFGEETTFSYQLAASEPVTMTIFDAAGRRVRALMESSPQPAGSASVRWNGRDDAGRRVASGTYYARLSAGGRVTTRGVTLVR